MDFIGFKENIKIFSKTNYKTMPSSLMSVMIFFFSVSMFGYLGLGLFLKNEPQVIQTTSQYDDIGPYGIEKNGIELFISLEFPNFTYYLNERIYTVSAELFQTDYIQVNNSNIQNVSFYNLSLMKCSDLYNKEEIIERNISFPIQYFYCLSPSNLNSIQGFWGSRNYKAIKFSISKCQNSSEIKNCLPQEEIDSYINHGVVQFYLLSYFINQKSYHSALNTYYEDVFSYLSAENSVNFVIKFEKLIFSTDSGLIFQDTQEFEKPYLSKLQQSYNFNEQLLISSLQIAGSQFGTTYLRSYIKIQDLLVRIGGLMKALTFFSYLINYFFSKALCIIDLYLKDHSLLPKVKSKILPQNIQKLGYKYDKNINLISTGGTSNTDFISSKKLSSSMMLGRLLKYQEINRKKAEFSEFKKGIVIKDNFPEESDKTFFSNRTKSHRIKSLKTIKFKNKKQAYSKFTLLLHYWFKYFKSSNNIISKNLSEKEHLINRALSVEYLTRKFYELEIIKIVLFKQKEIETFNKIYKHLFTDTNNSIPFLKNYLLGFSKIDTFSYLENFTTVEEKLNWLVT
jgi:hypothetical protein